MRRRQQPMLARCRRAASPGRLRRVCLARAAAVPAFPRICQSPRWTNHRIRHGQILLTALGSSLDSYKCGLPIGTQTASLNTVDDVRDLKLNMSGSISGGQVIGQFEFMADTTIELYSAVDSAETGPTPGSPGIQDPSSEISKPLVFSGIITLDDPGRPHSAELSTIEASPDDPGRQEWDKFRAVAGQLASAWRSLKVPPEVAEAMRFRLGPELAEAMRFRLPPEYLEMLRSRASDEDSDQGDAAPGEENEVRETLSRMKNDKR